ncbi:MAG: S9 family peptidase [Acidobacteriota bacterium]
MSAEPRTYRWSLVFAVVLGVVTSVTGQPRRLELDDVYHPTKKADLEGAELPRYSWTPTGHGLLELRDEVELTLLDPDTGAREVLLDRRRLEQGFAALPGFDAASAAEAAKEAAIVRPARPDAVLLRWSGDLYLWIPGSARLPRLTDDPQDEEVPAPAPVGLAAAFVRNGDLYVVEAGRGPRALTTGGGETLLNGKLDWVYQEEIYGRGNYRGYWWSPDARYIAFLQLDVSSVPKYTLVDDRDVDLRVSAVRYPRSGEPNPRVRLGLVRVADGRTCWADLSAYDPEDLLIVRVAWRRDGEGLAVQVQNRTQTWLDLLAVDLDGKVHRLLRETTPAWVNVLGDPRWLADGSFLWESERSGRRHVYLYGPEGELRRPVTEGDWEVTELLAVDEAAGWVYVAGGEPPGRERHLYRVSLEQGRRERLTASRGTHSLEASADAKYFVDTWSNLETPPRVELLDADGTVRGQLAAREPKDLEKFTPVATEFATIPARDGFPLPVLWVRPADFAPDRRYPVVLHVYGGPQSPVVVDRWGGRNFFFHHYLAEQDFLVLLCDNRASGSGGVRETWKIHHRLGEVELRDLEDVVAYLRSLPYVDAERIGLWGWSYGGYLTAYALTHSDSFRAGIAGAPVTDWRLYDSIYTERYMGLPRENPEGYRNSSVLEAAERLHGRLLLIHGEADDNVHPQNSRQLADRLQKLGRQFDLMMYPGERHGIRNDWKVYHLRRMMSDFFLRTLGR